MCDAPTSAAEAQALAALERAGWSNAELIWEQIAEAAAECAARGAHEEAEALWQGALEVAREHLEEDDPRRATSLVNAALGEERAGREAAAKRLRAEALAIWSRSGRWLEALRAEPLARSSTFHLRLERKHRGAYDRLARERLLELAAEGRAGIEAHVHGVAAGGDRFSRWRRERPAGFTDARKLAAAVLLMAPSQAR